MIKDAVVMLSERPDVRVHNDPLRMRPARESRLWRDAIRRGGFLGGTLSLPPKKGYGKKFSFAVRTAHHSGCRIGVRHDKTLRPR
jgi:hypothetical protein